MRQTIARLIVAVGATGAGVFVPAPVVEAGGGGCHGPATEGSGTVVEMKEACFTPTVLRVQPGTTVEFVNRDPMTHVVLGIGWGRYEDVLSGAYVAERFDTAGIYPYSCPLHPAMNGVVLVGDGDAGTAVQAATSSGGGVSWRSPAIAGAAALVGLLTGRSLKRCVS